MSEWMRFLVGLMCESGQKGITQSHLDFRQSQSGRVTVPGAIPGCLKSE
jgi:hypothetical protein